jgi:3-oxoadipate enol-lactonase
MSSLPQGSGMDVTKGCWTTPAPVLTSVGRWADEIPRRRGEGEGCLMATLQLEGASLYYEVDGQGIPVTLAHGMALDARMWDDQASALSAIARVIRYDARGFGRSPRLDNQAAYTHADDLWALLDHLDVESTVLVGLSMGGATVVEAALRAPQRVRALVLLDAFLDGVPWDVDTVRGMEAISEGMKTGGLPEARAAWLRHPFFGPARRQSRTTERLAQMADDYSGAQWTGEHDPHGPRPDCRALLGTINAPTTVVVGALDVPCFRAMAEVLASEIPGARRVVVPDAGHMVNMEAPEPVNALLSEVLRSAPMTPAHPQRKWGPSGQLITLLVDNIFLIP